MLKNSHGLKNSKGSALPTGTGQVQGLCSGRSPDLAPLLLTIPPQTWAWVLASSCLPSPTPTQLGWRAKLSPTDRAGPPANSPPAATRPKALSGKPADDLQVEGLQAEPPRRSSSSPQTCREQNPENQTVSVLPCDSALTHGLWALLFHII